MRRGSSGHKYDGRNTIISSNDVIPFPRGMGNAVPNPQKGYIKGGIPKNHQLGGISEGVLSKINTIRGIRSCCIHILYHASVQAFYVSDNLI